MLWYSNLVLTCRGCNANKINIFFDNFPNAAFSQPSRCHILTGLKTDFGILYQYVCCFFSFCVHFKHSNRCCIKCVSIHNLNNPSWFTFLLICSLTQTRCSLSGNSTSYTIYRHTIWSQDTFHWECWIGLYQRMRDRRDAGRGWKGHWRR